MEIEVRAVKSLHVPEGKNLPEYDGGRNLCRIGFFNLRAAIANPEVDSKAAQDPVMNLKFMVCQGRTVRTVGALPSISGSIVKSHVGRTQKEHENQTLNRLESVLGRSNRRSLLGAVSGYMPKLLCKVYVHKRPVR